MKLHRRLGIGPETLKSSKTGDLRKVREISWCVYLFQDAVDVLCENVYMVNCVILKPSPIDNLMFHNLKLVEFPNTSKHFRSMCFHHVHVLGAQVS